MFMKVILFFLYLANVFTIDLNSKIEELKFFGMLNEEEPLITAEMNVSDIELIDVRCFWVKGWNVYDISNLERSKE